MAKPAWRLWHLVKALPVIAALSLIIFLGVPYFVEPMRITGDFDPFFFPDQPFVGQIIFAFGTVLLVWAVFTFAIYGRGTPFRFDAPRHLVITGPYAWVRNPMVVGVVLQGLGMGVATGSMFVIVLFLIVGFLWHIIERPGDEDQLQKSFGRAFELYRRSVRCWIPLTRRWSPPVERGPISLEELPNTDRRGIRRKRS